MDNVFRNPALQHLMAKTDGAIRAQLQASCPSSDVPEAPAAEGSPSVWFPERGVGVLQQRSPGRVVELGLLHAQASPVVPLTSDLQVRSVSEAMGYSLPLPALMAHCPELVWLFATGLQQQMACWAACLQQHAPQMRLAGTLLCLHRVSPQAHGWAVSSLPGLMPLTPAGRDGLIGKLAAAGAVHCQGDRLRVLQPAVLERLACSCMTTAAQAEPASC